ncbi:MAG TPA: 50S ribosomal protein L13 [Candidatus Kapabacteria bacterium]|nr:50S ribosomal protein L13 [Candidatus Kapabacteria bacterium]
MKKMERTTHEIDAAGQTPGRLATRIAMILRGKNKATFEPHIDNGDYVSVVNASQLKFTGRKLVQKDFRHHTMYPGGLKVTPMKKVFENDPAEVLRHAVWGMLPKNKHREPMFKRLTIKP